MTRLPHFPTAGTDPDAFIGSGAFVEHLEQYAASFDAPVVSGRPRARGRRHRRRLPRRHRRRHLARPPRRDRDRTARTSADPGRPRPRSACVPASAYRNPDALAPGGVLVVGASSSGVQIADELARSGREVTLAVGRHTRMPRRYRGLDAYWWLQVTGRLARTIDTMPDPRAARLEPSLQLVGTSGPPEDLDLGVLQHRGVRLVGRVTAVDRRGRGARERPRPVGRGRRPPAAPAAGVLRRLRPVPAVGPRAAAFRPASARSPSRLLPAASTWRPSGSRPSWSRPATTPTTPSCACRCLGSDGQIRQVRGRTAAPGLYVVGQRFQHRRDSGADRRRPARRPRRRRPPGPLAGRPPARSPPGSRRRWPG